MAGWPGCRPGNCASWIPEAWGAEGAMGWSTRPPPLLLTPCAPRPLTAPPGRCCGSEQWWGGAGGPGRAPRPPGTGGPGGESIPGHPAAAGHPPPTARWSLNRWHRWRLVWQPSTCHRSSHRPVAEHQMVPPVAHFPATATSGLPNEHQVAESTHCRAVPAARPIQLSKSTQKSHFTELLAIYKPFTIVKSIE